MRKLALLGVALLLTLLVVPMTVAADVSSDDITVTVTGDGTWSNSTLSVSLFPGQAKVFLVTVNSTADESLVVSPVASLGCVVNSSLTACFAPVNATLPANGYCVFNLTVAVKGNAPPGVFSSNLTIEADTEVIVPPPSDGIPHHVVIASAQSEPVAGDPHELTATVYDSANVTLPNVAVSWSVLSGSAVLSSLDLITDSSGRAHAAATYNAVGTSKIRCRAEGYSGVLGTIDLTWVEDDGGNGNGNGIPPAAPNIRSPLSTIAFGELLVDGALDKTITIYNDGNAPLVIASVARSSGSADFAYVGPLAPFTVGSSGSTVITVRFTPSSAGDLSATFTVTSNDPDTPSLSFTVSGTGKSRGQPAWKVFLIGILIIGGCFGGFIYYKRWRAKREGVDILARAGGGEVGDAGDVLNVD